MGKNTRTALIIGGAASARLEPSSVLLAMGLSRESALGALRLTLGRWSTEAEIDLAGDLIVDQAKRLTTP